MSANLVRHRREPLKVWQAIVFLRKRGFRVYRDGKQAWVGGRPMPSDQLPAIAEAAEREMGE